MKDCFYQYRLGLVDKLMYSREYEHVYGNLYNWWVTQQEIGSTSAWRVPSDAELTAMLESLYDNYDDWFLPSQNELHTAFTNVDFAALGYPNVYYWSSTEGGAPATEAQVVILAPGIFDHLKTATNSILPFRSFDRNNNTDYALGDEGPAGGRIGIIVDNGDGTWTYYEAAPAVIGTGTWSNITDTTVGTSFAIGDGQANTTAIIAQAGHTASAALSCDDLETGDITSANIGNHLKSTRVDPDEHPRWDEDLANVPLDTWGFGALPGGFRRANGTFTSVGYYGIWYSSTEDGADDAWGRDMDYDDGAVDRDSDSKNCALSIRLVRNATGAEIAALSDGDAAADYTGNDGKTYSTVFLNNLIWLAENLAETKYRNGTDIPKVTVSADWIALTDGAYCAYDNDDDYAGVFHVTRRTYNDVELDVYEYPPGDATEPYILITNMMSTPQYDDDAFSQEVTTDIHIVTSYQTDKGGGRDSDLMMNDLMELLINMGVTPAERRGVILMDDFVDNGCFFVSLSYESYYDGAYKYIRKILSIKTTIDEV